MDDVGRKRHLAGLPVARHAVALTMATCLLASCTSQDALDRATDPNRTMSGSPTSPTKAARAGSPAAQPTPSEPLGGLTLPGAHNPVALAHELDRAAAVLRDRDATATDVRRAGEFRQLAVLTLVTASDVFRRTVTTSLRPETALVTRSDVRAARLLREMTSPQKRLPHWRIVAPAPEKELLGYYQEAQRRIGVPWTYLAAIHLVETRMGRIRGTSTAGARGPMQFLPSTWARYGAGGNINDPRDAILAAARLLKDNGAPGDMAEALWHFNQSDNYVRAVTEYARTMQRSRSAYRGYWHWRVLYRHARGTYVLPVGYPKARPVLLREKLEGAGGRTGYRQRRVSRGGRGALSDLASDLRDGRAHEENEPRRLVCPGACFAVGPVTASMSATTAVVSPAAARRPIPAIRYS